ncbi:MAG: hypothetical protein IPG92_13985 [Flavobacteriales bacterium]|nr:hypothetical protein [Flavobacteriales bacterium]
MERLTGRFAWSYVEFPHDVKELFGKRGDVRKPRSTEWPLTVRSCPPRAATTSSSWVAICARRKVKRPGDMVTIELWLDPEPDRTTFLKN